MIHKLRNTPVRDLIRALELDGFQYRRRKGSQRVYRHPDGRRVVIHFHHAKDTLPPGTLRNFLEGTRWAEDDKNLLSRGKDLREIPFKSLSLEQFCTVLYEVFTRKGFGVAIQLLKLGECARILSTKFLEVQKNGQ